MGDLLYILKSMQPCDLPARLTASGRSPSPSLRQRGHLRMSVICDAGPRVVAWGKLAGICRLLLKIQLIGIPEK